MYYFARAADTHWNGTCRHMPTHLSVDFCRLDIDAQVAQNFNDPNNQTRSVGCLHVQNAAQTRGSQR